jgi:uncharacterized protein (TIGR02391 family)
VTGLLSAFERVVRSVPPSSPSATKAPTANGESGPVAHPFEERNIHPDLPRKVKSLFDDGHLEQATFEAFKFIESEVRRASGLRGKTGFGLMMEAFNETNAKVVLNSLVTDSDVDEQRGYRSIFAGASAGIRNPRGHEVDLGETPDETLDYLALASLLLRKLDAAGAR